MTTSPTPTPTRAVPATDVTCALGTGVRPDGTTAVARTGRVLCSGPPAAVQADPVVQQASLGLADDTDEADDTAEEALARPPRARPHPPSPPSRKRAVPCR